MIALRAANDKLAAAVSAALYAESIAARAASESASFWSTSACITPRALAAAVKSAFVDAISAFKLPITTARASSFSVSTELIKSTISLKESLSAADADKIASTRAVSAARPEVKVASPAVRAAASETIAASAAASLALTSA